MTGLSTITKKHQITIPVNIVNGLGLSPSDKVVLEMENNWIKILPLKERSFLDLHGSIKSRKKYNAKGLRKRFEKEMAKSAMK